MKSGFCYGAVGLFLLVTWYFWATYASLFEVEKAYLYNPETQDIFEVEMRSDTSPHHIWDMMNPLGLTRRRDPDLVSYLGHLSEAREAIKQYDRRYLEYSAEERYGSFLVEYYLNYFEADDEGLKYELIPDEWSDLIKRDDRDNEVMLANAVIIEQEWPNGYTGEYATWPVRVKLASNVLIFFGHTANELCVKEWARIYPRMEAVVREGGCFFPLR